MNIHCIGISNNTLKKHIIYTYIYQHILTISLESRNAPDREKRNHWGPVYFVLLVVVKER